ncbi:MAG TPA: HD domain-containing protein [Anaerolineae bacterium]|nr:HD domain-containing protein [Anaerolineae bacterium]
MKPLYRARQFCAALTARVTETDLAEADRHLPPRAQALFRQMPRDGQAHALRVLRELKRTGRTHPALLAAALLHDVGKSAARTNPLTRAIFVVLKHWAPAQLAQCPATGWRKPLAVLRDHPRLGAKWARVAGCDELTIRLIGRHQEKLEISDWGLEREEDRLLRLLQEVDDRT